MAGIDHPPRPVRGGRAVANQSNTQRTEHHLPARIRGLSLQVDELGDHLVADGDDAGVRLEAALGDDEVGELF